MTTQPAILLLSITYILFCLLCILRAVSLYLLLNLAEDMHTESKMVKKDLIKYLLALLERNNIELLILVMSFIKKLSVVRQNKDFLVSCEK